jgi:hypothetical protein
MAFTMLISPRKIDFLIQESFESTQKSMLHSFFRCKIYSNCMNILDVSSVLKDFYYSTSGDQWYNNSNWLTSKPLNAWFGIVTNIFGEVIEIHLPGNCLEGGMESTFLHSINMKKY